MGTVERSTARLFLEREQLPHQTYESVAAALKALEAEEIEMIAAASPGLDWLIEESGGLDAVVVEDTGLDPHYVAFALAPGSELRKPLNAALLRRLSSESGWNLIRRYLPAG